MEVDETSVASLANGLPSIHGTIYKMYKMMGLTNVAAMGVKP